MLLFRPQTGVRQGYPRAWKTGVVPYSVSSRGRSLPTFVTGRNVRRTIGSSRNWWPSWA